MEYNLNKFLPNRNICIVEADLWATYDSTVVVFFQFANYDS